MNPLIEYFVILFSDPKPSDPTPGGAANVLLLESGDGLLLEDGSFILLE